ncbi:MAG: RNA polymerase sigma factor [Deltaproteobacteria bacterium]|nr:RNA polymerase sigma factor [Deltaproteobacteria bacterium]
MTGSPPSSPELDTTIIMNALAGDASALSQLCVYYQPQVLRVSMRAAARAGFAEDGHEVAQEVWCRLLDRACRRLQYFSPCRGSFGPFLRLITWQQALSIVSSRARRGHRDRALESEALVEQSAPCHATVVEARCLARRIVEVASLQLDDVDRRLLVEIYLGDASVQELAPRMGSSTAALYKRSQRLRSKLARAARRLVADERARRCARQLGKGGLRPRAKSARMRRASRTGRAVAGSAPRVSSIAGSGFRRMCPAA